MRNYLVDWNNMNVVIVKKEYLKKVQSNKGWQALEAQAFKSNGFSFKNGTKYTVGCVEQAIRNNRFFSQALPSI